MERPRINISIKENSWIARVAANRFGALNGLAIVFFRTIHLDKISRQELLNDIPLLRHEVRHVLQYQEQTYILFLLKYIWYSFRKGYYMNPFEVDARNSESDETILSKVNILSV